MDDKFRTLAYIHETANKLRRYAMDALLAEPFSPALANRYLTAVDAIDTAEVCAMDEAQS